MRRIIYCSQSTIDFSPEELVDLLEAAREHNAGSEPSGMLLYCSQSFLQMLEGNPAFPDWTMGFTHVDEDELADELDGYVPETDHPLVNPDLITSGGVAQRLLALSAENRVAR